MQTTSVGSIKPPDQLSPANCKQTLSKPNQDVLLLQASETESSCLMLIFASIVRFFSWLFCCESKGLQEQVLQKVEEALERESIQNKHLYLFLNRKNGSSTLLSCNNYAEPLYKLNERIVEQFRAKSVEDEISSVKLLVFSYYDIIFKTFNVHQWSSDQDEFTVLYEQFDLKNPNNLAKLAREHFPGKTRSEILKDLAHFF